MSSDVTYDWSGTELTPVSSRILSKVVRAVLKYNPKRVLDIGCGNGHLCKLLSDKGIECVGIDPIPDAITQAKKVFPKGEFYVISCYEDTISQSLGKFDIVTSTEVIEHLYFPRKLISFTKNYLETNGIFIITTPDYSSYWRNLAISLANKWDYHHSPLWDGGHIKFWSKKTVSNLVTDEGFSIEQWEKVPSMKLPIFSMSMICHARLC